MRSLTGNPDRVAELITTMAAETGADEVIVQDMILDQRARRRSYQLLADTLA